MADQFLVSVVTFSAATFPVWVLYRAAVNIFKRRRNESVFLKKEALLTLFFLYVVAVLAITVIPLPFTQFRNPTTDGINLVPFVNTAREFAATLTPRTSYMTPHFLKNILGNVILFIPLGIFLPLVSAKFPSLKKVLPMAFGCSLTIEIIQYISAYFGSYRSVDIDDIILNTFGAFVGFVIFDKILSRFLKPKTLT